MANMSYCRFENTLYDLKDCIDAMETVLEGDKPRLDISAFEFSAARSMVEYCQMYIDAYNELVNQDKIVNRDDSDFRELEEEED